MRKLIVVSFPKVAREDGILPARASKEASRFSNGYRASALEFFLACGADPPSGRLPSAVGGRILCEIAVGLLLGLKCRISQPMLPGRSALAKFLLKSLTRVPMLDLDKDWLPR
jgi:hypothetical protein